MVSTLEELCEAAATSAQRRAAHARTNGVRVRGRDVGGGGRRGRGGALTPSVAAAHSALASLSFSRHRSNTLCFDSRKCSDVCVHSNPVSYSTPVSSAQQPG